MKELFRAIWRRINPTPKDSYVLLTYENGTQYRMGPMAFDAAEAVVIYRFYDERTLKVVKARIIR
jgi:hypothetical protein